MCIVPDRFNAPSSFVLILGGTIAASTLMYYWLELPAIGLGRQLVASVRTRQPSAYRGRKRKAPLKGF